jgi:DNA-binding transcriptional LysR family regulator
MNLPDFEAMAVFAKVVELRSFAAAAAELKVSKATVSKAVARIEMRLGTRLFNRTSRRLALTDAGRRLALRAARLLADGEAAEDEALAQSAVPRGTIRLAAPMSFGLRHVSLLLPEFLEAYPEVTVELQLSDARVDIIGEGFDAALRIGQLPDSSLVARRLCGVSVFAVGAPSYFSRHGRPTHPLHLAEHSCLTYTYLSTPDVWRFTNSAGEVAAVRPSGRLRANNGDAMLPALLAGLGLALLPDFLVGDAIAEGRLETILPDWSIPRGALHFVTPPGGPRPARITALADFLAARLARANPAGRER